MLFVFLNVCCLIIKLINGLIVFFDKIEIEEDLFSLNNDYLKINKNILGNIYGF